MIAQLPNSLIVNGKEYNINSDFKTALLIFQIMNDDILLKEHKLYLILDVFYGFSNLNERDYEEAYKKMIWFLDGGKDVKDENKKSAKLIDWEQDEHMIFSAINKVAGFETRKSDNIHWWTFLGYFNEIDKDSVISNIILIRQKKSKGKKLEKYEQLYYRENKEIIDFKKKYSKKELEEIERLNLLLK